MRRLGEEDGGPAGQLPVRCRRERPGPPGVRRPARTFGARPAPSGPGPHLRSPVRTFRARGPGRGSRFSPCGEPGSGGGAPRLSCLLPFPAPLREGMLWGREAGAGVRPAAAPPLPPGTEPPPLLPPRTPGSGAGRHGRVSPCPVRRAGREGGGEGQRSRPGLRCQARGSSAAVRGVRAPARSPGAAAPA